MLQMLNPRPDDCPPRHEHLVVPLRGPAGPPGASGDEVAISTVDFGRTLTFGPEVQFVRTAGYHALNDGGASLWVRSTVTPPPYPGGAFGGWWQDAAGTVFEIAEWVIDARMTGVVADYDGTLHGGSDQSDQLDAFLQVIVALMRPGKLPPRAIRITRSMTPIPRNNISFDLTGWGMSRSMIYLDGDMDYALVFDDALGFTSIASQRLHYDPVTGLPLAWYVPTAGGVAGTKRTYLAHFGVRGQGTDAGGNPISVQKGIAFRGRADGVTVEHVTISECYGTGLCMGLPGTTMGGIGYVRESHFTRVIVSHCGLPQTDPDTGDGAAWLMTAMPNTANNTGAGCNQIAFYDCVCDLYRGDGLYLLNKFLGEDDAEDDDGRTKNFIHLSFFRLKLHGTGNNLLALGRRPIGSVDLSNPNVRIVLTDAAFAFVESERVRIADVAGTIELNGNDYAVHRISDTVVELNTPSAGKSPYISGGTITPRVRVPSYSRRALVLHGAAQDLTFHELNCIHCDGGGPDDFMISLLGNSSGYPRNITINGDMLSGANGCLVEGGSDIAIEITRIASIPSTSSPDAATPGIDLKVEAALSGPLEFKLRSTKSVASGVGLGAATIDIDPAVKHLVNAFYSYRELLPVGGTRVRTGGGVKGRVMKTTDMAETSGAMMPDPDLLFVMQPDTQYSFMIRLHYTADAAGDFRCTLNGPVDVASVAWSHRAIAPGGTAYASVGVATTFNSIVAVDAGTGAGLVEIDGMIDSGPTGGNFRVIWGQITASANPTVLRFGSLLEYIEPVQKILLQNPMPLAEPGASGELAAPALLYDDLTSSPPLPAPV